MFTRNYFILPWISRSVCIPKTYFTFFKNSFWFEYISLICRVISVWFTKLPRDHRSYQVKSFVLFLLSNFNESDSFCRDNISLCFAVFYWSIFNTCILGGSQISFLVLIIPCRPMPMFLISNLFCLVLKMSMRLLFTTFLSFRFRVYLSDICFVRYATAFACQNSAVILQVVCEESRHYFQYPCLLSLFTSYKIYLILCDKVSSIDTFLFVWLIVLIHFLSTLGNT